MKLEPISNRVVLEKIDSGANIAGLYLPEEDGQGVIRAKVIAVGPGRTLETGIVAPMQCKVGDIVFVNYLACAPTLLPLDAPGKFYLIPETDIAAIVREE